MGLFNKLIGKAELVLEPMRIYTGIFNNYIEKRISIQGTSTN